MTSPVFSAAHNQASTLYLPPGPWLTVLDCLCDHFPAIDRSVWLQRMARGRVLDAAGTPIDATHPYRAGLKVRYFREVPDETPIPFVEQVLWQDEHLLVADDAAGGFFAINGGGLGDDAGAVMFRVWRKRASMQVVPSASLGS